MKKIKPSIIPLFIPHVGCPFQCAFCNQKALTSVNRSYLNRKKIIDEIETHLSYRKSETAFTEIAFYGGTFLGLERELLIMLLDIAQEYVDKGKINSIRFSTRPDTITSETLDLLKRYSVETVEIGVQSMDDDVLKSSNRGHTKNDVIKAVGLSKERGYKTGMQIMVGLPSDGEKRSISTALETINLKPDMIRIYPALVLKNSPMEEWYRKGQYRPMGLFESVNIVKKMYALFLHEGINIIRVGVQASNDLNTGSEIVDGPYHPSYGHIVSSAIFLDMIENALESQNRTFRKDLLIETDASKISEVRGLKNCNTEYIKEKYGFKNIKIAVNSDCKPFSLLVNGKKTELYDIVKKYRKSVNL